MLQIRYHFPGVRMYSISFLRTTKQERKNDTKFKLISLFKLHFTMRFQLELIQLYAIMHF